MDRDIGSQYGTIPARRFAEAISALVGKQRMRYETDARFHTTIYTLALEIPWPQIGEGDVAQWITDNDKKVRAMQRSIEDRLLLGSQDG
jgi:hypothetical protein